MAIKKMIVFAALSSLHTYMYHNIGIIIAHITASKLCSLTLGAHAQRGLQLLFCHSVCLSVTTFSAATRNKTANKRYYRVQCYIYIVSQAIRIFPRAHAREKGGGEGKEKYVW